MQGVTKSKYNDMLCELEEQRELAANRLTELERLQRQHEEKVAECAKLSMQVRESYSHAHLSVCVCVCVLFAGHDASYGSLLLALCLQCENSHFQ